MALTFCLYQKCSAFHIQSNHHVHQTSSCAEYSKGATHKTDHLNQIQTKPPPTPHCIACLPTKPPARNTTNPSHMDWCNQCLSQGHVMCGAPPFGATIRILFLTENIVQLDLTINNIELAAYVTHLHLFDPRISPLEYIFMQVGKMSA